VAEHDIAGRVLSRPVFVFAVMLIGAAHRADSPES
jgi:hypothetical protein